jgi:tellurite resistance protein TehA-like permease
MSAGAAPAGGSVELAPPPGGAPSAGAGLRGLNPAYFALVMATGIVSLAWQMLGQPTIARFLFALNVPCYLVLWLLFVLRAMRYPDAVRADFMSHGRVVGFFTMVAGTCVLGSQTLLIGGWWRVAAALWALGILLWATLTYAIFGILTVKAVKPTLAEGISGGWLVAVVAGQSVAVLGVQLAPHLDARAHEVLLFCLAMWLGSGMLYIWIISLIFYRYTFFALHPADLAPPYWINMGAVAISTLAGTGLVASASQSALIDGLLPFIKGFTLLFWATATWWIPMLVILGIWRHLYARLPLAYDPLYWGAVFPLGMYAACTWRMAHALDAPELLWIPPTFAAVALAAWTLAFLGLLRHLARSLRGTAAQTSFVGTTSR